MSSLGLKSTQVAFQERGILQESLLLNREGPMCDDGTAKCACQVKACFVHKKKEREREMLRD